MWHILQYTPLNICCMLLLNIKLIVTFKKKKTYTAVVLTKIKKKNAIAVHSSVLG